MPTDRSIYYRWAGPKTIGTRGVRPEEPEAVEVSVEPTGDWYPVGEQGLERQDGLRTWELIPSRARETEVIRGYYHRTPPGRDVCLYCGYDTTGARIGFDCAMCGGN